MSRMLIDSMNIEALSYEKLIAEKTNPNEPRFNLKGDTAVSRTRKSFFVVKKIIFVVSPRDIYVAGHYGGKNPCGNPSS